MAQAAASQLSIEQTQRETTDKQHTPRPAQPVQGARAHQAPSFLLRRLATPSKRTAGCLVRRHDEADADGDGARGEGEAGLPKGIILSFLRFHR